MNPQQVRNPGTKLRLRHTLHGHSDVVLRLSWSPDGFFLASSSVDKTARIWYAQTGACMQTLTGHYHGVNQLAWAPDGATVATASFDRTIRLWDWRHGRAFTTIRSHRDDVTSVSWNRGGELLASGSVDRSVRVWSGKKPEAAKLVLDGHTGEVSAVAWNPEGTRLASASFDRTIRIWDPSGKDDPLVLSGHRQRVYGICWSPDGTRLASASKDRTIRLWDPATGREVVALEGHMELVCSVSFSADGKLLASKAGDGTVRLWRTDTWQTVEVIDEPSSNYWPPGIAFHPSNPLLATLGDHDTVVRIWEVDSAALYGAVCVPQQVHYTNARIALVGDQGVGKTGLGWRLAHGEYQPQSSTHGQQFWILSGLRATRQDGAECEPVLWDFAGQPDYRIVHSLFLEDVDVALILFDATREDSMNGVDFWLNQLRGNAAAPPPAILVAARADVSAPVRGRDFYEEYCRSRGLSGGYLITSARTGFGLEELIARLREQLRWEERTPTITTATFQRIKAFVLGLKETSREGVLVSPAQLRTRLEAQGEPCDFNDRELLAALEHLANHGYVTMLRQSSGEESILLAPDLLINLASSFVLRARLTDLGCLEEELVLHGGYDFPELTPLADSDRRILLDAATGLFLKHHICFREKHGSRTLLIFPSLINLTRRGQQDPEVLEDASYRVRGAVENLYAALVVLLGYTSVFTRTNQWRNEAEYEIGDREICGFRLLDQRDGQLDLVLFYGAGTSAESRRLFEALFEKFLRSREVTYSRIPAIVCHGCGSRQERGVVTKALEKRREFLYCPDCGNRIVLSGLGDGIEVEPRIRETVRTEQIATAQRTEFEFAIAQLKGYLRDRPAAAEAPTCFISYAWGDPEHERWVGKRLACDLIQAGVNVILDQRDNAPFARDVARFVSQIDEAAFVLVIGTPNYLRKYENRDEQSGTVVAAEVDLIHQRLLGTERRKRTVLPVLAEGSRDLSFPPLLRGRSFADLRQKELYWAVTFDVILTLYQVDFTSPGVEDLRERLRRHAANPVFTDAADSRVIR